MTNKPTNTQQLGNIMDAVMSLTKDVAKNQAVQDGRHKEYKKEFAAMQARQDHTNGNVKDLLLWQSNTLAAEKAVEDYRAKESIRAREEQGAQSGSNPKVTSNWLWILVAVAAALIAIGQAIGVK